MRKTKIWILEKKTDFESYTSARFKQAAKNMNIDLKLIAPEDIDLMVTKEDSKSIIYKGNVISLPDFLIPRIGTISYYALAIIRQLERFGVFVLNSSQSMEISKDKLSTLQLLSTKNISVPKTMLARFPFDISLVEKEFSYPIIVKTVVGSRGRGVFCVEDRNKLKDLINLLEISKDPKTNLILQEFVSTSRGKDIRVIIIGGRAIGAMLRKSSDGSFKANYSSGGLVENYKINPTIEWLAVESAKIVGLDIAGVDILFDRDSYKVCEVNSYPGFEGFEKATKINLPEEIFKYIMLRLG
ncbi:MAG: RimK family alpha-L-glutamate ligase [Actinomycetota bacterium]|nr:RimK family alpha-L-glutamate ligase [Actinomycetota bacterium]